MSSEHAVEFIISGQRVIPLGTATPDFTQKMIRIGAMQDGLGGWNLTEEKAAEVRSQTINPKNSNPLIR